MYDVKQIRRAKRTEAGVSLLEVLIAVSLLAICFTAIFSGLSTALRAADRLGQRSRVVAFAANKLNEVLLEPGLEPGQEKSGVSDSGLRWRVKTEWADTRPGPAPDRPVQLMRVMLEVSWTTPAGVQSLAWHTLKLRIPEAVATP